MAKAIWGDASFFEQPRRRPLSSGSQEPISPYSKPAATPSHATVKPARPRLQTEWRGHSDSNFSYLYRGISTIKEEASTCHSTSTETPVHYKEQIETSDNYTPTIEARRRPQFSRSAGSSPGRIRCASTVSYQTIVSRRDTSFSHEFWSSSAAPRDDSSSPSHSLGRKAKAVEVPLPPVLPLRPPSIVKNHADKIPETRIKIERSFTGPEIQAQEVALLEQSSRRTSSINPRQLFSASINTLRRRRKMPDEYRVKRSTEPRVNGTKLTVAKDHRTSLQTQHTTAVLIRVASLLKEMKLRDNEKGAHSRQLVSSSNSQESQPLSDDVGHYPMPIGRVRSMELKLEDTESHSSSSVKFQSKETPYNTPEEQAKYVAVNQNGELEEFLKVDISTRGQTSYLPSEARRIHTPPYCTQTRNGKRRGFFFDYNLPTEHQIQSVEQDAVPTSGRQIFQRRQYSESSTTSHVPTISKGFEPKPARHSVNDWFTNELAEVDSMTDGEINVQFHKSDLPGRLRIYSDFEKARQYVQDEEQLDYSIPEHLPTSPLCPRHPRYWRIVKNKGSQLRGCWMHGFDEFDQTEKAKYGIVDTSILRRTDEHEMDDRSNM